MTLKLTHGKGRTANDHFLFGIGGTESCIYIILHLIRYFAVILRNSSGVMMNQILIYQGYMFQTKNIAYELVKSLEYVIKNNNTPNHECFSTIPKPNSNKSQVCAT